jgi:hypothetical protein
MIATVCLSLAQIEKRALSWGRSPPPDAYRCRHFTGATDVGQVEWGLTCASFDSERVVKVTPPNNCQCISIVSQLTACVSKSARQRIGAFACNRRFALYWKLDIPYLVHFPLPF